MTTGKYVDLTDERYGSLVAVRRAGKKYWLCECDCGVELNVRSDYLRSGSVVSCGCQGVRPRGSMYGGKTVAEIAKILDYSPQHIHSIYNDALAKLRRGAADNDIAPDDFLIGLRDWLNEDCAP